MLLLLLVLAPVVQAPVRAAGSPPAGGCARSVPFVYRALGVGSIHVARGSGSWLSHHDNLFTAIMSSELQTSVAFGFRYPKMSRERGVWDVQDESKVGRLFSRFLWLQRQAGGRQLILGKKQR